jgi:hypothetical protein
MEGLGTGQVGNITSIFEWTFRSRVLLANNAKKKKIYVKICTLTNSPFPDLFFRESDRYSTLVHAVSALRFKRIDFKRVRFLMVRESQHSLSVVFDVSSWSTFRIMRFSLSNLKLRRFSIRHLRRQQKLILNHQTGTGLEGYGRAPSLNFRKPPDPA